MAHSFVSEMAALPAETLTRAQSVVRRCNLRVAGVKSNASTRHRAAKRAQPRDGMSSNFRSASKNASKTVQGNAAEEPMRNTRRPAAGWRPKLGTLAPRLGPKPGVPWRSPCETLEQQQDSSPCQAQCSPTKCFPSPLESIKTVLVAGTLAARLGPKPVAQRRSAVEEPMRNTRTAAGVGPMPNKMQSDKMLPVTFEIHKNSSCGRHSRCEAGSETSSATQECRGGAHAKHSNSSRIRAHAKQNAVRQNASRHLWNP